QSTVIHLRLQLVYQRPSRHFPHSDEIVIGLTIGSGRCNSAAHGSQTRSIRTEIDTKNTPTSFVNRPQRPVFAVPQPDGSIRPCRGQPVTVRVPDHLVNWTGMTGQQMCRDTVVSP